MTGDDLEDYYSEIFGMHFSRLSSPDDAFVIWIDSVSQFEEKHIRAFCRAMGKNTVTRSAPGFRQRPCGAIAKIVTGRRYVFRDEQSMNEFMLMLTNLPKRNVIVPLTNSEIDPDFLRRHFRGRNTAIHLDSGEVYFSTDKGASDVSLVMLRLANG